MVGRIRSLCGLSCVHLKSSDEGAGRTTGARTNRFEVCQYVGKDQVHVYGYLHTIFYERVCSKAPGQESLLAPRAIHMPCLTPTLMQHCCAPQEVCRDLRLPSNIDFTVGISNHLQQVSPQVAQS